MSLLLAKLVVTPLIVIAASLAARRWGDAVAGWMVGLPLTSGPVSVFLALERGPEFAAQAANGSLAGVLAQAAFCFAYGIFARRGPAASLAAATVAYAMSAAALIPLGLPSVPLFLLAVAALTLVIRIMPREAAVSLKVADARETLVRAAVTTALVVFVTMAASALGPEVSGVAASFPLIGASIAAFAHLAVEPQQVVLGKGKSADGGLGVQAAMGSMPIVSMEPSGQLGGAFV